MRLERRACFHNLCFSRDAKSRISSAAWRMARVARLRQTHRLQHTSYKGWAGRSPIGPRSQEYRGQQRPSRSSGQHNAYHVVNTPASRLYSLTGPCRAPQSHTLMLRQPSDATEFLAMLGTIFTCVRGNWASLLLDLLPTPQLPQAVTRRKFTHCLKAITCLRQGKFTL